MLALRIASAIIGGPAVLLVAWWGGAPLAVLCYLAAAVGIEEMANMFSLKGMAVSRPIAHSLAPVCIALCYYGDMTLWSLFPALGVVAALCMPVILRRWSEVPGALATLLAIMYSPYLVGHLLLMRNLPGGERLVILVLALTWATDTAAYFAGTRLGRRRLCPELSPKKSWEGAFAGLIAGAAVSAVIGPWAGIPAWQAGAIGFAGSVFAQLGDLFESAVKRYTGVKDSGRLIPGHGGILDRIDSLLFSGPAVYWLVRLILM